MKTLLLILTLITTLLFTKVEAQTIPEDYYFDYTDSNGNNHNLQDYFDQEKSVFVYYFDNSPYSYQSFENLNLIDFYNTYGQGGNNDVVVLCAAIYGFDTYQSLSNLDFSSQLGPGYENVSYTENNPIPMIINPIGNDSIEIFGSGVLRMFCYDDHYASFNSGESETYMNKLYDICCTSLETYDPGLEPVYSNAVNCNTLLVNYRLTNGTPTPFSSTDLDVWINGEFDTQFTANQLVEGCSSVAMEYSNLNFSGNDAVTLAISNSNTNTANDTLETHLQNVDTVSGQIRIELENLTNQQTYGYLDAFSGQWATTYASSSNNFLGELYLTEGCHRLSAGVEYSSDDLSATVLITSLNSSGSTEDTLYLANLEINEYDSLQLSNKLIYVNESADPLITGYVFEDINITQQFQPTLPRISGVEVTHGPYSTYTDVNGYYQLPLGNPNDPISIVYNDALWQVITTSNPLFYNQNSFSYYNFGLNQDDPVYGLQMVLDSDLPFICSYNINQNLIIDNTGNQLTGGEVVFTYDPLLTPISFSPQPSNISNNELTYQISDIAINGTIVIGVTFDGQASNLIGEIIQTQAELWYEDESDNLVWAEVLNSTDSIYCSYDPNDIYGFPLGAGEEGFIPANTPLDYRIRFQNTGNYPATTVVLVNILPEELNWDTFVPKSSSHNYSVQLNEDTREMRWTFNNINLPDSSSDPLGSIGNVWYSVEMNDLDQGDQILNEAAIYFDSNPPIFTNTSLHTIQGVTSVSDREAGLAFEMWPNPAMEKLMLQFENQTESLIEIVDLQGRKCIETRVNSRDVSIPIHHLESGMYLISITRNSDQIKSTARFIKI